MILRHHVVEVRRRQETDDQDPHDYVVVERRYFFTWRGRGRWVTRWEAKPGHSCVPGYRA